MRPDVIGELLEPALALGSVLEAQGRAQSGSPQPRRRLARPRRLAPGDRPGHHANALDISSRG
jgi:hypothetical protein